MKTECEQGTLDTRVYEQTHVNIHSYVQLIHNKIRIKFGQSSSVLRHPTYRETQRTAVSFVSRLPSHALQSMQTRFPLQTREVDDEKVQRMLETSDIDLF